ncbi:Hydrolase, HAD superfamily [Alteracholeplasma palmae J233]|uniref:Hydrolase, HAD superfamily n=1 Tax=Alteracholeplasma palmae (strain ATCC 49389 / J233) TaxID=1318466 RepID=U4KRL6_ALTPJ|nr:YqeG family HAD IIIA-type phosphatase [Alteracholeplasma palmae]CCV64276.1 Hydrolase, HAD superfamily [Alteracholeplasma palmae J233]
MAIYNKCIPLAYYASIYEIPYQSYKQQGINALFFDLDNTIISYEETELTTEHVEFLQKLEKDFKVVIVSNARSSRVLTAIKGQFSYVYLSKKPFKGGYKKALKLASVNPDEVLMIGDQLMTDVYGASRMKIKAVLVKAVKRKSDHFFTRLNRKIEKLVLKKIKAKEPLIYKERLEDYVNGN